MALAKAGIPVIFTTIYIIYIRQPDLDTSARLKLQPRLNDYGL